VSFLVLVHCGVTSLLVIDSATVCRAGAEASIIQLQAPREESIVIALYVITGVEFSRLGFTMGYLDDVCSESSESEHRMSYQ
jgi:hypothetical protein